MQPSLSRGVDTVTFLHRSAWVSTRSGLLRLDLGVQPVKPVVVEVARHARGRTAAIGEALLLMSATVPTTVSMLTNHEPRGDPPGPERPG